MAEFEMTELGRIVANAQAAQAREEYVQQRAHQMMLENYEEEQQVIEEMRQQEQMRMQLLQQQHAAQQQEQMEETTFHASSIPSAVQLEPLQHQPDDISSFLHEIEITLNPPPPHSNLEPLTTMEVANVAAQIDEHPEVSVARIKSAADIEAQKIKAAENAQKLQIEEKKLYNTQSNNALMMQNNQFAHDNEGFTAKQAAQRDMYNYGF